MSSALILAAVFIAVLFITVKPLGLYMLPMCEGRSPSVLSKLDPWLLKFTGGHSGEQTWKEYAFCLILFNLLGIVVLYALQRLQHVLPLNVEHLGSVESLSAFNTAVSFITNTNWQGYAGESTMGYLVQMAGIGVQNFLSAATGIAVAFVLMRSFVLKEQAYIGNFFADITRISIYLLLPLSIIYALFLVSQGVIQNFDEYINVNTIAGGSQTLPMGPVASQEAIKLLGTNGGGFFNANSAHPFENPTALSNFSQCLAIFLIPAALCYTFGALIKDKAQGLTLLSTMTLIFGICVAFFIAFESEQSKILLSLGSDSSFMNLEGKELRFDLGHTSLFSTVTTAASCGAVNNMHDSLNPISGMITMLLMQLGEIVFGGVGSGFYGIIIMVLTTVFICGLMVGHTPLYLGKKIGSLQMKLVCLAMLTTPCLVLLATAITCLLDFNLSSLNNTGTHGFSEYLYAFSSAANNNGSAFAGLNANTPYFNIMTALCMFFGRFIPIICVLALAGSFATQSFAAKSAASINTKGIFFTILLFSVILLVGALTYMPALSLGPIAEHLASF